MKFTLIAAFALLVASTGFAQDKPLSPSKNASAEVDGVKVQVDYSAPSAREREIFGELVPYDKVWRTGANEATTIMLGSDMKINGKMLSAGKYSLFTIPGEKEWTVIFNKQPKQWGAYKYDESQDALRVSTPAKTAEHKEQMEIRIEGNNMVIHWADVMVSVKMEA